MIAFHGKEEIKKKYIKRVRGHAKADRIVKGETGLGGKGCAVACTLDMVYDHSRYPIELGIPEWLARVEDALFEGMSLEKSKTWPELFLKAINVGSALEKAKSPFIIYILEKNIEYMDSCSYDKKENPDVKSAINGSKKAVEKLIKLWKKYPNGPAAYAANAAAWSAADSAAWSAANAAAYAAKSAANAAASAAWSAANAAAYDNYADKLIEILKEIK